MTWEMNIRFEFDISDLLSAEEKLAFNKQLPEFVAKTLAAALRDQAEKNTRSKISNGGFGQELAEGVRTRANGTSVIIDHTSNDTNHLAEERFRQSRASLGKLKTNRRVNAGLQYNQCSGGVDRTNTRHTPRNLFFCAATTASAAEISSDSKGVWVFREIQF